MPDTGILKDYKPADDIVTGYCLSYDTAGVPTIEDCVVRRMDNNGHYMLIEEGKNEDEESSSHTFAILTLADTFFIHKYPALLHLWSMFRTAIERHQRTIAYLETERDNVDALIQYENQQREQSDGA